MTAVPPPAGTQPGQYDLTSLMNLLRGLSPLNAGAGSDELNRAYLAAQAQQNAALLGQTTQLMSQDQTNRMRMMELMGASPTIDPVTGKPTGASTPTDAAQRWRSELEAQQRIQDTRLRQEYGQMLGYAVDANGNPTTTQTLGGRQQTEAESARQKQDMMRYSELMGYQINPITGQSGGQTLAGRQLALQELTGSEERQQKERMQRAQYAQETAERTGTQTWQSGESAAERAARLALQESQQGWQSGESAAERALRLQLQEGQQTWQSGESKQERDLRERLQSGQLNQQESEFARTYLLQQQESRRQQAALGGRMDNGDLTEAARATRAGETTQRAQLAAQLLNSPKDVFKAGAFFRTLNGNNPASMGLGGGGIMGFNSAGSRAALPGTLSPDDVYSQMGADQEALPGATVPPTAAAPGATQAVAQGAAAGAGGGVDVTGGAAAAPAAAAAAPSPAAAGAAATPPAAEPPVPGATPGGPVGKTMDRQLKGLGMEQWLRSMQQGAQGGQGAQKASPRSRWGRAGQSRAKGGDAAQRDATGTARTAELLAGQQQQLQQAQMGLPGGAMPVPGGEEAARMAVLQQQLAPPQAPMGLPGGAMDAFSRTPAVMPMERQPLTDPAQLAEQRRFAEYQQQLDQQQMGLGGIQDRYVADPMAEQRRLAMLTGGMPQEGMVRTQDMPTPDIERMRMYGGNSGFVGPQMDGGMAEQWRMALGQQPMNLPQTGGASMLDGWRQALGQQSMGGSERGGAGVPETGGGTSAGDFLRTQEMATGGGAAQPGAGFKTGVSEVPTGTGNAGDLTAAMGAQMGAAKQAGTLTKDATSEATAQTQGPESLAGTSPGGPIGTAIDGQLGDLGMNAGGNFPRRAPAATEPAYSGTIPYIDPRVFQEPAIQKMTRELRRLGRSDRAALPSGGRRGPSGPGGPVGRAEQRAGTKASLVEVGPYRFGEQTARDRQNATERFLRGTALINQRTRAGMGPGGPVSSPQWPSGDQASAPMPQVQDAGSVGGSSFQPSAAPPPPAAGVASVDPFQQDYALSTAAQVAQGGVGAMGPQTLERMSKSQRGTFEGALQALGLNPDDFNQAYAQTRFNNTGSVLSA